LPLPPFPAHPFAEADLSNFVWLKPFLSGKCQSFDILGYFSVYIEYHTSKIRWCWVLLEEQIAGSD
jgi:hypothetical protein